jgi:predicted XRE-type DNA-binding protein
MTEKIEIIRGSGNIYKDFGDPDADVRQTKAILAAEIINILDDRGLSTREAEKLTGIKHSEFVRIRNAELGRFTIDRLIRVVNSLGREIDVKIKTRELEPAEASAISN